MVIPCSVRRRYKWRSLDPHYDYGHKSDEKAKADAKTDNEKSETAAKSSSADDSKRWELPDHFLSFFPSFFLFSFVFVATVVDFFLSFFSFFSFLYFKFLMINLTRNIRAHLNTTPFGPVTPSITLSSQTATLARTMLLALKATTPLRCF